VGLLCQKKTVWWLVSFVWNGISWQYASIQDSLGELQVNDISNQCKTIQQLEPHQAYEALGVFLAPDGNCEAQLEKMRNAVVTGTDGLRTGKISRDEVWLALQSTIFPTLSYPLPALHMTKAQWEKNMSPLLQYCLPALGVCQNFPRKLVFAPYDYMGLNFLHLHMLQEIYRLKDIIFHSFNETLTGQLYTSSIELLLLELGCNSDYQWTLALVDKLSTAALVKDTWIFLSHHKISLKHNIQLSLPWQQDQFIMVAFLALNPSLEDLIACNHCRMFLRALYLSDITTGDGTSISEDAWNGRLCFSKYKLRSWTHYGKPPQSCWEIWRKWVKFAFLGHGRRLRVSLGAWLVWDNNWPWYTAEEGSLYQFVNGQWLTHAPIIRRNRLPSFSSSGRSCKPSTCVKRVSIYMKNDRLVSTGDAPISAPHTTIPDFFRAFLETDKDIQWCLYGLSIQEENRLLEALKDGTAMAISDGSYKDTFGTAAWTIGNQETASIIAGKAVCPGAACDHDAYRGELAGIYSIMVIMERFCDNHNIKDCAIEIGCDGKSSLETALEKGTKLFRDIPSFDLVAAIMQLHRNSPLTWTSRFVKGHQDDEGHDLHSWATRNVLMDLWAKQQLAVAKSSPRHFSDKGEPWQLWVAGRKLTSNISNQIYLAVHRADGISYWQSKPEVSAEVTNTVDWVAIGHTMKGVVRGRTVFVSKHMSGMCGVGKFMQRWQQWETDQCPRCGEKEDSAHVWTCQDLIAREIRSKSLASIELLLRQWNTDPTIVHVLLLYLKSWQTGEGVQYQPPRELEAVIQEQTYISWNRFFEGWFSTRWAEILQRFYTITKSNCTGKR
jgi:hypothetical protein